MRRIKTNIQTGTLKKHGKELLYVNIPNLETIIAMEELKAGKGKRFKSVDALFKRI